MHWVILLYFLTSFFLVLFFTPLGIRFAIFFGLIDDPKTHKHPAIIHTKPTPRAGGLPLYAAIALSSVYFFGFSYPILNLILVAGAIVVAVGLMDDKYDLSPYVRFFLNIFSAVIVVLGGVSIPFVTNPLGGILHFTSLVVPGTNIIFYAESILAVAWIVWVMNMLNWSKGVDGQMPGIAAIASFIIGVASLRFGQVDASVSFASALSFIVAGASVGFLFYNFYPAKIFPGYSSTILGFLIGVLSILSGVKLATALLVMGVPVADALFTVARRVLSKRSPFWHDKGHLHHLLLAFGLSQRKIALFYWIITIALGFLALQLSSRGKLFAMISVIIVVSAVIITLKLLIKHEKQDD